MLLKDQVVIVTGAGKGIGRETALRVAREGAAVVAAAHTASDLESLVKEIKAGGGRALAVPADVSVPAQAKAIADGAIEAFGKIDVLINNAGGNISPTELIDLDVRQWDQVFNNNIRGSMLCSQYALKHMVPRKSGSIIHVASTALARGLPGLNAYAAAKFALVGLTRAMANELGKHNIRVNVIVLGHIKTDNLVASFQATAARTGVPYADVLRAREVLSPMNRLTDSSEVADFMVFLSSHLGRGINGQSLTVASGGWMNM